jgi:hypothetical protein
MSFQIITIEDDRNHVATETRGVYMVYKRNRLAEFEFSQGNSSADLALYAANQFLNSRKDKANLRIVYIPRERF